MKNILLIGYLIISFLGLAYILWDIVLNHWPKFRYAWKSMRVYEKRLLKAGGMILLMSVTLKNYQTHAWTVSAVYDFGQNVGTGLFLVGLIALSKNLDQVPNEWYLRKD